MICITTGIPINKKALKYSTFGRGSIGKNIEIPNEHTIGAGYKLSGMKMTAKLKSQK